VTNDGGNNGPTGVTITWVLVFIVLKDPDRHSRAQQVHGQCHLDLDVLKIISCPDNIVRRALKDGPVREREYIMLPLMALKQPRVITSVVKVQATASQMKLMHLVASVHLIISVQKGQKVRYHVNRVHLIQKKVKTVVLPARLENIVLVALEHRPEVTVVPLLSVSRVITVQLVYINQYHVQLENMEEMVSLVIRVNRIVKDVILENIAMKRDSLNQIFRIRYVRKVSSVVVALTLPNPMKFQYMMSGRDDGLEMPNVP